MTDSPNRRVVSHFSCGAASAINTKLAIAEYGHENLFIVNAFVQEELDDNRRFLADCEKWFEHEIHILAENEKYNASAFRVWEKKRFIKSRHGAPCSMHLKRELLNSVRLPGDLELIGYTAEETDRLDDLRAAFPDRNIESLLIQKNLSKDDCLAMIDRAGLVLPLMYRMGYDNANCPCCPKGGQAYWQNIREDFPANFARMSELQRQLGPGSYFLRFRSGSREGQRMPLWDLPEGRSDMKSEPSFSCSFFCDMAEQDIAGTSC